MIKIDIAEIDKQHARWLKIIEGFRAVGVGHLTDAAGFAAAEQALAELLEYTRMHFASEEAIMARHGYPGLAEHHVRHGELMAAVEKMLAEIRAHKSKLTPLKLNLLATIWLFEHIAKEDQEFGSYVHRTGHAEG
ncbi:hypothetical protein EZJ19_11460 [Parasulfuritortus cantonensis]|uniref:Hemerythrin-like domain-containing protein n=1 Tax=Parasulfuritortus cantonensis TaxID=2528202 RepID=A0A4R1B904_9PROT|nr:hemerythrin domain-containing protein [Parasulfuritortus cantonensis]TCJ12849.1 hypothetical protein EZJ19_11460 [Parasulfuritortus cantonensis]